MKLMKVVMIGCVVLLMGCSSLTSTRMFEDSDSGYVLLTGDAEGIRAYNDGLVGHITEGKNNPENKSAYWQSREQETNVRVMKFRKPTKQGGGK